MRKTIIISVIILVVVFLGWFASLNTSKLPHCSTGLIDEISKQKEELKRGIHSYYVVEEPDCQELHQK